MSSAYYYYYYNNYYYYYKNNNNNNHSHRAAGRFAPEGGHSSDRDTSPFTGGAGPSQHMGHFPIPAFPPYAVKTPQMHGAPATEDTTTPGVPLQECGFSSQTHFGRFSKLSFRHPPKTSLRTKSAGKEAQQQRAPFGTPTVLVRKLVWGCANCT